MSRRADCWDNAVAERFFTSLKLELVYQVRWRTRAEICTAIFEYLELLYNRCRRHSSLGYRLNSNGETGGYWLPNPGVHQLGASSAWRLVSDARSRRELKRDEGLRVRPFHLWQVQVGLSVPSLQTARPSWHPHSPPCQEQHPRPIGTRISNSNKANSTSLGITLPPNE